MTNEELLLKIQQEIQRRNATSNFKEFIKSIKPSYMFNWHHDIIINRLDELTRQTGQRIIISVPPQYGKSELVSRLYPAYVFGINPDAGVILASYSSDLAQSFNRDVQRYLDSEPYAKIFTETSLNARNVKTILGTKRTSNYFEICGHSGYFKTTGVGGSLTGFSAKTLAIIDDPTRNRQDADSKAMSSRLWEWYTSVFQTRYSKDVNVILMCTRWSTDDLVGRLLEQSKAGLEKWEVISLPAICEEPRHVDDKREIGQALWPEYKGDSAHLHMIQKQIGQQDWASLYQQRPTLGEFSLINNEMIDIISHSEIPDNMRLIISVDATFKATEGSDFVAMQVWGQVGCDIYCIHTVNSRLTFMQTIDVLQTLSNKYNPYAVLIEDKANGPAIIDVLSDKISGIVPINPKDSKKARLQSIIPMFIAKNIHILDTIENRDFIAQLLDFPHGSHDDMVDACTQAASYLRYAEAQISFMSLY